MNKTKVIKNATIILLTTALIIVMFFFVVIPKVAAATGCFPDTNGHWAETFICWMKDSGITGGYPDGTYRPENQVTRAEMAVFTQKSYDFAQANDDDTLGGLSCSNGQVTKWNGTVWVCGNDGNTPDTLDGLSCSTNQIAKWNGSAWVCAADVDTTGNTGQILINSGPQNWTPHLAADPINIDRYSNRTWFTRTSTGDSYIHLSPEIPAVLYGKRLKLMGVKLCYNAQTDVILDSVFIQRAYGLGLSANLFTDLTDRTDDTCRTYTLSTPYTLTVDDTLVLTLYIKWTTANLEFRTSQTTFILEPSTLDAEISTKDGLVKPPGKGNEGGHD